MYLRRHCYDKPWRCPGWAGGGWSWAEPQRCDGGSLGIHIKELPLRNWRFGRCGTCDVLVIPLVTRWVDPTYLWWRLKRWPGNVRERREWRRYQQERARQRKAGGP